MNFSEHSTDRCRRVSRPTLVSPFPAFVASRSRIRFAPRSRVSEDQSCGASPAARHAALRSRLGTNQPSVPLSASATRRGASCGVPEHCLPACAIGRRGRASLAGGAEHAASPRPDGRVPRHAAARLAVWSLATEATPTVADAREPVAGALYSRRGEMRGRLAKVSTTVAGFSNRASKLTAADAAAA